MYDYNEWYSPLYVIAYRPMYIEYVFTTLWKEIQASDLQITKFSIYDFIII